MKLLQVNLIFFKENKLAYSINLNTNSCLLLCGEQNALNH